MSFRSKLSRLGAPLRADERARLEATEDAVARSRRGTGPSPSASATAASSASGRWGHVQASRDAAASEVLGVGDRESVLSGLRAQMAALLERSPGSHASEVMPLGESDPAEVREGDLAPAAVHDPASTELPFLTVDWQGQRLTQRLEAQAPSAHVGRIPIDSARTALASMLALLGLDPDLAKAAPSGALYLDTETTGLGGAGTVAFLVGLGWFDESGAFVLEQLLLKEPAEEVALLERVRHLIERSSMLVTYNGKAFDMPLLQGRMVMNRLPPLPQRPHLDLLHVARRLHKRRLGACRLIHLESHVLGWERDEDDIPGAEIAPRYGHFLRTGDAEALRAVVDHNLWDVLTMAALVGLYGEPLPDLHGEDLIGVARTLKRAKAFDDAHRIADVAVSLGAGPEALRARGEIAKARGDRERALLDFEQLSAEVDDSEVRLELAKLYEHYLRRPLEALALLDQGTGEGVEATARRRRRLERKVFQKRR